MELDLNDFVAAVLWACLGVVAFFSVASRLLHARAERRLVETRVVCRICGNVFLSPHSGKVTDCPSCGKPNLHSHNGKLG